MTTVADLVGALDAIAPFRLAEDWDNVGLIAGARDWDIRGPVLVTIDLTPDVAREAITSGIGAIVAYHPPIFSPIKRLTADSARSASILDLLGAKIAIVSPHTALDAAPGGLADFLADAIASDTGDPSAGSHRVALTPHASHRSNGTHKIVTFAPGTHADPVRDALAAAGAGVIGEYTSCAFAGDGRGSFRGSDASNPVIGARGVLETVEEVRLEMVCPSHALAAAIAALRAAHPYEEPPIDIHPLAAVPDVRIGAGRAVTIDRPIPLDALVARTKKALGVSTVWVAKADSPAAHARVGVCPGAGGSLIDGAIAAGCTAFLTGEMRHHDVLSALDRGVSVILAGHTETERPYLPRLAHRLHDTAPTLTFAVSKADRSPFAR